jgi:hypothetical protein
MPLHIHDIFISRGRVGISLKVLSTSQGARQGGGVSELLTVYCTEYLLRKGMPIDPWSRLWFAIPVARAPVPEAEKCIKSKARQGWEAGSLRVLSRLVRGCWLSVFKPCSRTVHAWSPPWCYGEVSAGSQSWTCGVAWAHRYGYGCICSLPQSHYFPTMKKKKIAPNLKPSLAGSAKSIALNSQPQQKISISAQYGPLAAIEMRERDCVCVCACVCV